MAETPCQALSPRFFLPKPETKRQPRLRSRQLAVVPTVAAAPKRPKRSSSPTTITTKPAPAVVGPIPATLGRAPTLISTQLIKAAMTMTAPAILTNQPSIARSDDIIPSLELASSEMDSLGSSWLSGTSLMTIPLDRRCGVEVHGIQIAQARSRPSRTDRAGHPVPLPRRAARHRPSPRVMGRVQAGVGVQTARWKRRDPPCTRGMASLTKALQFGSAMVLARRSL